MIAISIDLPPALVTPHNKGHWYGKAAAVREYRLAACAAAKHQANHDLRGGALPYRVRVSHTWYLAKSLIELRLGSDCPTSAKRYRPADEGNAIQALKPAIDGLVDAGLLRCDRAKDVCWGRYTRLSTQKEHQGLSCVVLTLEPDDLPNVAEGPEPR